VHDTNLVFWTAEGYHSDGGDRAALCWRKAQATPSTSEATRRGCTSTREEGTPLSEKPSASEKAPPPEGTRVTFNVQENGPAGFFLPSATTGCYVHPRGGYATLSSGTMIFFDAAEPPFRCRFEAVLICSVGASRPRGRATSTTRTSVPPRHHSPPSTTS